jgi:hypothetical protein
VVSRVARRPSRRVICSLADENYARPLAIAASTFERYALLHGWRLDVHDGTLAPERPTAWSKLLLIRALLADHELVWWIDADAVIVDMEPDVLDQLERGKHLYLTVHTWGADPPGRRSPNSGVMLWRRSDWSLRLLDTLWNHTRYMHHPWWENAALLDVLGYRIPDDGTPPIPGTPTAWSTRVKDIGLRWNSTENASLAPDPIIRHIGRRNSVDELVAAMQRALRPAADLPGLAPR